MNILHQRWLLVLAGLILLAGCASIGPPLPPSLELPKAPTNLHAARKGDRVTLTWTIPTQTTDRASVRYLGKTRICRTLGAAMKQCETPVGEAAAPADFTGAKKTTAKKVTATFTDTLAPALQREHSTGFADYAVEVTNAAGKAAALSNQVHVALVPTLPPFGGFQAHTTGQGVMISWECLGGARRAEGETKYLFRIYRREEGKTGEARIAQLDAKSCVEGSGGQDTFLDQSFAWENTYFYRACVVSEIEVAGRGAVEVEGDDTAEVKIFAHDVFPPGVPAEFQAVFSGPGQRPFIDLIWAPVTDADLEGYNVYRHEESGGAVKLNAELVKTPSFRDEHVEAGKRYFYSVTAVDQRGNESARSEEASERVP